MPLFLEACTRRGVAATDNLHAADFCGAEIVLDFSGSEKNKPRISASQFMVDALDLEMAAQFIASWSRPVFGQTTVAVAADVDTHIVTFNIMSELCPESFIAYQRLENLTLSLADVLSQALKRAAPSLTPTTQLGNAVL